MKQITLFFLTLLLFSFGCVSRTSKEGNLISMQIIDRNGFSETIGTKDRLAPYKKVNFITPQPYQKVLRVFSKNEEGKSRSSLTTYHSNGQVWQSLDILDGRAHGKYRQWHPNGMLHIELTVIDGIADTTELAQKSWLFDEKATVFDDRGHLIAEITYDKGVLQHPSLHFHPNGQLQKRIPYVNGEIHGVIEVFDNDGNLIENIAYENGLKEGLSVGFWDNKKKKYEEHYEKDALLEGAYFDKDELLISKVEDGNGFQAHSDENNGIVKELHEYRSGKPEGLVKIFSASGALKLTYMVKDGMKHGEEINYYPTRNKEESPQPKLLLTWHEDTLQGPVKTWYHDGTQESSKELYQNKKQGYSFAWYTDGSLMLSEEYNHDKLVKGRYFAKGNKYPVSKIENGKGTAVLFDESGNISQKIEYDNGKPLLIIH